mgnify:CR=1 FL=1
MTTALLQLLDVSLGLILMQPVGNLEERIYNFFVLEPFLFAKRNGPFAKRNDLFAKGNGPNEKRNNLDEKNYQLFSKSNNFFKLSPKFKISLAKIEVIKPLIPKAGTKKKIKLILTNKSIILIKRTLT